MRRFLMTALFCTIAAGGCARSGSLADGLRGCRAGEGAACARAKAELEAVFTGGSSSVAERERAAQLADAAMIVAREQAANESIDDERWARVLTSLFRGDDARLEASPDRALARAVAARLVELAAPKPRGIAPFSADAPLPRADRTAPSTTRRRGARTFVARFGASS